ncbi:putative zinc binding dehydrogenase [Delitschia confertaspora ATCC 74209]|uniref:Zinc binding dehydrogenase n=1 Tax=Delitschia confertaspora ATCC 74209 TaxID=1513339 RepID=A0A9P4JXD9_9PLEO|nr:putative zinc binding dehydrogenase [Delitschia confertaspora ATCC 74209]
MQRLFKRLSTRFSNKGNTTTIPTTSTTPTTTTTTTTTPTTTTTTTTTTPSTIRQTSTMAGKHLAAILPKTGPLEIAERNTPEPGPNEVLIQVKAVALNPIDFYQRDFGMPPVPIYPAVLGSDTAGIVAKVGSNVTTSPPVGSRAIALASSFYQNGSPDHGAFQQYALAQAEAVIALPDKLSFEEGSVFPLGTMTALTAWTTMGISLSTQYSASDKQAVLIWGGASSVGTYAVQSAKTLGFTTYVTASSKHHEYLKKLGAHAVFDYKDADVVAKIVDAVKKDGVNLYNAHCVVDGGLQPTLDVLKETKGGNAAQVAHSPMLPPDHPTLDNTTITFNLPSMDKAVRDQHIADCFHGWLAPGLKDGSVVPSPSLQVEKGGLEGLNAALDKLRAGVSGTKIVVPL